MPPPDGVVALGVTLTGLSQGVLSFETGPMEVIVGCGWGGLHALECVFSMAPSQEGRNGCPGRTREYRGHSVRRAAGGRHPEMDSCGRSRLPGLQLPLGTGPRLWPQGGWLCRGHSSQHFFLWGVAWRSRADVASSAALRLFGFCFVLFCFHFWSISVSPAGENKKHKRKQLRQSRVAPGTRSGAGRPPAKHCS